MSPLQVRIKMTVYTMTTRKFPIKEKAQNGVISRQNGLYCLLGQDINDAPGFPRS